MHTKRKYLWWSFVLVFSGASIDLTCLHLRIFHDGCKYVAREIPWAIDESEICYWLIVILRSLLSWFLCDDPVMLFWYFVCFLGSCVPLGNPALWDPMQWLKPPTPLSFAGIELFSLSLSVNRRLVAKSCVRFSVVFIVASSCSGESIPFVFLWKWYCSFVDGGWGSVRIGAEETHNPNLAVCRGPPVLSALSGEPR